MQVNSIKIQEWRLYSHQGKGEVRQPEIQSTRQERDIVLTLERWAELVLREGQGLLRRGTDGNQRLEDRWHTDTCKNMNT